MTLTLGVQHLAALLSRGHGDDEPVPMGGLFWAARDEVRLYDRDGTQSVPVADPAAHAALRSALSPSGEYLGEALLLAWVRAGAGGPEIYDVYWLVLGGPPQWGPRVTVRPVPPEHDYLR